MVSAFAPRRRQWGREGLAVVLSFVVGWVSLSIGAGWLVARKLQRFSFRLWAGVLTGLALMVLPSALMMAWLFHPWPGRYITWLPPAFEVEEVVKTEQGAVCSLAAFRYSEAARQALAGGGLSWLNSASTTRAARGSGRSYMNWAPTPHPDRDQTLRRSSWIHGAWPCLEGDESLERTVDRALRERGAYFTRLERGSPRLLLIPSRQLIVYLADGM